MKIYWWTHVPIYREQVTTPEKPWFQSKVFASIINIKWQFIRGPFLERKFHTLQYFTFYNFQSASCKPAWWGTILKSDPEKYMWMNKKMETPYFVVTSLSLKRKSLKINQAVKGIRFGARPALVLTGASQERELCFRYIGSKWISCNCGIIQGTELLVNVNN